MRQIKFRGKCQRGYDYSDGDGWIYGSLLQKDKVCAIVKTEDIDLSPKTDDGYSFVEDFGCVPVIPETIGQFTGLTDRNGKEIYEGDIVKVVDSDNEVDPLDSDTGIGEVIFLVESGLWYISSTIHNGLFDINDSYYIEIIGNIHDNPELLNEKQ